MRRTVHVRLVNSKQSMTTNENPFVSVVIPLYNCEDYVEQTLRSICTQTLDNIEIIVINDGSTDQSLSVVEQVAREESKIKIYSQENKGQSLSRNRGIGLATGEYIYFMDSDDILDSDTLEKCYHTCKAQTLDIVCFDAEILNKENGYQLDLNYDRSTILKENNIYTGTELLETLIEKSGYTPSPCLFLIRKDYLDSIRLRFFPGIIHEDQLFTPQLYLQTQRIGYIASPFFKRRIRGNSTMTTRFSMRNINGYFTVRDELIAFAKQHPHTKPILDRLLTKMLSAVVWLSYRMKVSDCLKVAKGCMQKNKRYVPTKEILKMLLKALIRAK